ncbi:MAG: flagellin [Oscillospiraceae bacterium]
MIIQHNLSAINAHRQGEINKSNVSKSLEKLSSGYRINRAGDDAAGLAISEKMRGQISGLGQAVRNAQDGISLIQTAEGGLGETHSILQRMRELSVQSANGTYDDTTDRKQINKEMNSLKAEIDRISTSTEFNGKCLLNGSAGGITITSKQKMFDGVTMNITLEGECKVKSGVPVEITVMFGTKKTPFLNDCNKATAEIRANNTIVIFCSNDYDPIAKKPIDGREISADEINAAIADAISNTKVDKDLWEGLTLKVDKGYKVMESFYFVHISGGKSPQGKYLSTHLDTKFVVPKSSTEDLTLQIGANGTEDQRVGISINDMSAGGIGVKDLSVATRASANDAISAIDNAVNCVSSTRADLGALQNRLEHTIANLGVTKENVISSESRIRDVDMASEMMSFTKNQILAQASQAMLAQANALPQGILQLLQ